MRFIHTADWHLGRLFHGVHLTEDQAHVLDEFCDAVKDSKPNAVVIAGDIYDRSVPPPEAVELFNDVLNRLSLDLNVPVILIAGNHDSPQRLGFGCKLLARGSVHIFGPMIADIGRVTIEDCDGPVHFYSVPYADAAMVRNCFGDQTVVCHESAMRCCVNQIGAQQNGVRRVLIAHAFVVGGVECESERPLSVGGAGTVPADAFGGFDYVALGHLHRPQNLNGGKVCYSGSLMKYSFSEADHKKSVSLVEIDCHGSCKAELLPLSARRDVRIIKGKLADVLNGPSNGESKDDYVHIMIEDVDPLFDAMSRIREVYPNALTMSRESLLNQAGKEGQRVDHKKLSDVDLFGAFFSQVTGDPMTEDQSAELISVFEKLRQQEREVVA